METATNILHLGGQSESIHTIELKNCFVLKTTIWDESTRNL